MTTMADPHIREIGRVEDDRGHVMIVGTGHGTVTLALLHADTNDVALTGPQSEELGQYLVAACWQAGRHQGRAQGGVP